jgi:hypothetical protein
MPRRSGKIDTRDDGRREPGILFGNSSPDPEVAWSGGDRPCRIEEVDGRRVGWIAEDRLSETERAGEMVHR